MKTVAAAYIGLAAQDCLRSPGEAVVIGVTSSGVFLQFPNNRIGFLTEQPHRGPMSINLPVGAGLNTALRPGARAVITPGAIKFSLPELLVSSQQAVTWYANPIPDEISPAGQIDRRFEAVGKLVVQSRPGLAATSLLAHVLKFEPASERLDKPERPDKPEPLDQSLAHNADRMAAGIRGGAAGGFKEAADAFLGRGEGLTPWGDDLILGALLLLNRWRSALPPGLHLADANQAVTQTAFKATTALSATLIECAAGGQADERLILALDGILTGSDRPETCAARLLDWGHSSGVACLAGAAIAWAALNPG